MRSWQNWKQMKKQQNKYTFLFPVVFPVFWTDMYGAVHPLDYHKQLMLPAFFFLPMRFHFWNSLPVTLLYNLLPKKSCKISKAFASDKIYHKLISWTQYQSVFIGDWSYCISESYIKIKVNLNFYFLTSLWYLKRFYEGLHKTFWGTAKKCENKKSSYFSLFVRDQDRKG